MRIDNLMDKVLKNGFKHSRSVSEFNIFFKTKGSFGKSQSSRKASMVPEKDGSSMTSINGCTPVTAQRTIPGSAGGLENSNSDFALTSQALIDSKSDLGDPKIDEDEIAVDGTIKKQHAVKFLKMFSDIPRTEVLINYYSCAYVGEILTQGYLYVSRNYFCFSSTLFGVKTQIIIPVAEVLSITLEKVAYLIPNAVGIVTQQNKYVFGSLLSRKQTFKLLVKVLEKYRANNSLGPSTPDTAAMLAAAPRCQTASADLATLVAGDGSSASSSGAEALQFATSGDAAGDLDAKLLHPGEALPMTTSVTPVPIDIAASLPVEDQLPVGGPAGLSHPHLIDRTHSRYLQQQHLDDEPPSYPRSTTQQRSAIPSKSFSGHTAPSPHDAWSNSNTSTYLLICFLMLLVTVLVSVHISYRISNIELMIAQGYQRYCSSISCSPEENLLHTLDTSATMLGRVKNSLDRLAEQMVVTPQHQAAAAAVVGGGSSPSSE